MAKAKTGQSELIKAWSNAIGAIGKICKENKNSFDNYDFASIDNFLAAVSPVVADNQLVISQQEMSYEIIAKETRNGKSQWLLFRFEFVIHHVSGEESTPFIRTAAVPFTGAQAFGSGQSYALKQFLRSAFLISTGDQDDPDFHQATEPPALEPVKPVTDDTTFKILNVVDEMEAFQSRDHFGEWLGGCTDGKTLADLTESQGVKILAFISANQNAQKWTGIRLRAYQSTIQNQETETETENGESENE